MNAGGSSGSGPPTIHDQEFWDRLHVLEQRSDLLEEIVAAMNEVEAQFWRDVFLTLLAKTAEPTMVLSYPSGLTATEEERVQEALRTAREGRSGELMPLPKGVRFEQVDQLDSVARDADKAVESYRKRMNQDPNLGRR